MDPSTKGVTPQNTVSGFPLSKCAMLDGIEWNLIPTNAASKWSRKREFGTAFILSPPLVPRAMQNLWAIACEPCGAQHGVRACFPRTNCPLGGNAAKLKVLSRLPVLQPEPLAIAAARRQSCCSERARAALWGSGSSDIRCWTAVQHSILALPAPVASRRARGLAQRCWACLGTDPHRSLRHQPSCLHEVILIAREHGWEADLTLEMGYTRVVHRVSVGPMSTRVSRQCQAAASSGGPNWYQAYHLEWMLYISLHFKTFNLIFLKQNNKNIQHEISKSTGRRQGIEEEEVELRLCWEFGRRCSD